MSRLVLLLLAVLSLSVGLSWLADRPGHIAIEWEGYQGELTVFRAVVIVAILTALATFVWTILRQLWSSPASVGRFLMKRKQKRGLDALSSGMIAVGAGDRGNAMRYALQARKTLPNEPLTHLLRAQAAQLSGDKSTARRIFEAMLSSPDTEQLGLRGLYLEAARMKENEAARQFAERAVRLNPKLSWPVDALFDLQCKDGDWNGALVTLAIARKHGQLDKAMADRRRAVLLTAQAQAIEDSESEKALTLAQEAHGLAPALVPAAAIAGRLLASRGSTPRAAKVLQKTWTKSPHPDLATAYAFARIGDSPRDRLDRVKQLAALTPHSIESPIAVATTAIEARSFADARSALAPLLEGRLTQRVATLMARIEGEEHGDKGKVREWLARAVNAPRDPAWTADGIVSDHWAPVSPVTGALDAFQWRVPVDEMQAAEGEELTTRLESLVALGAPVAGGFSPAREEPVRERSSEKKDIVSKPVGDAAKARPSALDVEVIDEPGAATAPAAPSTGKTGPDRESAETVRAKPDAHRREPLATAEPSFTTKTIQTKPIDAAADAGATSRLSEAKTAASGKPTIRPEPRPVVKPEPKGKRKPEARPEADSAVFPLPHAPDDPGPELEDPTEADSSLRPYRAG